MAALPQGYQLQTLDAIDSTNEEARRQIDAGEATRGWILAKRQSTGRGRQGRLWTSTHGNLFCSLMLDVNAEPKQAAQLSFLSALCVGEVLGKYLKRPEAISYKWPNDVLLEGDKVSGILLESAAQSDGKVSWLIIGIGVNLTSYPQGVAFPATALCEMVEKVPLAKDFLIDITIAFDRLLGEWRRGGFAPIREAWLKRAARLGQELEVRLPNENVRGRFDTLDENGALVLTQNGAGKRIIAAGDVYFDFGAN